MRLTKPPSFEPTTQEGKSSCFFHLHSFTPFSRFLVAFPPLFAGRTLVCVTSLDSSLWLILGHCCAPRRNPCKLSISTRGCGWLSACAGVTPNRRDVNGRADLEALRRPSCSSSTSVGTHTSTAPRIELGRPLPNVRIEHCANHHQLVDVAPPHTRETTSYAPRPRALPITYSRQFQAHRSNFQPDYVSNQQSRYTDSARLIRQDTASLERQ